MVGNIGRLGLKDFRRGAETGWRWRTLHDLAPGPNPDSARTRKTPRTGPGKNLALNPQSSPNPNRLGRGPRTGPNFWCLGAFGRSSECEAGVETLAQTAAVTYQDRRSGTWDIRGTHGPVAITPASIIPTCHCIRSRIGVCCLILFSST